MDLRRADAHGWRYAVRTAGSQLAFPRALNALFRGGPKSSMPPNKSAYDVIQYEIQELGNDIRSNLSEEELKQIPAYKLQWLTSDKDYASEFGDVYKVNTNNKTKIVAVDPNGGLLIFFESSITSAALHAPVLYPKASEDGSLGLRGGEALRLSSAGPCRASNPYADLALLDAEGDGIPLSMTDPGEGDILFAYCPSSGLLVPGMIHEEEKKGRRSSLMEMALSLPKGERAFVLNEGRDSLVTASLPSDSSDRLRLLPRLSVMSWLMSSGSRAAQESREYDVEGNGEFFVLRHRLGGPSLRGRFKGADKEIDDISWKVAITGLGGIIGGYDLEEE